MTENNSGHFSLLIMKHLHGILLKSLSHFFNANFNFNFFARFIAIFEQRNYIYKYSKQSILKGKIGMFILMRNIIPWHLRIFCSKKKKNLKFIKILKLFLKFDTVSWFYSLAFKFPPILNFADSTFFYICLLLYFLLLSPNYTLHYSKATFFLYFLSLCLSVSVQFLLLLFLSLWIFSLSLCIALYLIRRNFMRLSFFLLSYFYSSIFLFSLFLCSSSFLPFFFSSSFLLSSLFFCLSFSR